MTKILIDEAVVRQALEYLQDNQHLIADNERHAYVMMYNAFIERFEQTIAEAEKQQALDKKADNARELGLSYEQSECKYGNEPVSCTSSPMDCQCAIDAAHEQPAPSDMKQAIIVEASIQMTGHPSKDARWFAKSVYEYLMAEQPAQPDHIEDVLAMVEQPAPEPVAWMQEMPKQEGETRSVRMTTLKEHATLEWDNPIPLYTTPPAQQEPDPDELTIAYMSGVYEGKKAERKRILNLLMIQHEAAKGAHNYWKVAANLIQAEVASDT